MTSFLSKAFLKLRSAWPRWRGRFLAFFLGQMSAQAIAFATGLLLLRWLSETEYAKTGVVFGFQTLLAAFLDLGIGAALVSLIGGRSGSPNLVGRYIAAARWWRRLLLVLVLPSGALAFLLIYSNQGWPVGETTLLFLCVALSLYFSGWAAWGSAVLLLRGELGKFYFCSCAAALLRLGGCSLLHTTGNLNAVTLGLLGAAVSGLTALLYWRAALPFFDEPNTSDPMLRTEMRKLVAPLVPNAIFYALQAQVSMLLISLLGTTQGIAEVTALGRLGQIFAVLAAFYTTLVAPYFAQLAYERVHLRYCLTCGATVAASSLITGIGFSFPEAFLLLLGSKYQHLVHEVGWLVLGSTIWFVNAAMWSIHMARKWIYWSTTLMSMASVVVVQALFITLGDMGTTREVIYMGVATSVVGLVCQAFQGYLGLRSERVSRIKT